MTEQSNLEQPLLNNLTPVQMRAAIPRLRQLIAELKAIDVTTIEERGETRFEVWEEKIIATVSDLFGSGAAEYYGFSMGMLDTAPVHMMYELPLYQVRAGYKQGIEQAIAKLRAVIDLLEEDLFVHSSGQADQALKALEELDLYPEIERAAGKLFRNGCYAQAVKAAGKAVEAMLHAKNGKHGSALIRDGLGWKDLILHLTALKTESDKDTRLGMTFLCAGALLALKNPGIEELIDTDPGNAVEWVVLFSLVAKVLEKTEHGLHGGER